MAGPEPTDGSSGMLVLGAHRSGTSLLARLAAALGMSAGPADRLRPPDQFNPGGHFEDRSLIEWHDSMLRRCGGWASAPPDAIFHHPDDAVALRTVLDAYPDGGWFIKDPRQCLLLDAWERARGTLDRALVIVRPAEDAAASLKRRSGYSYATAFALWERYNHDLLTMLAGRRALLLHDVQVVEPTEAIAEIARFLEPFVTSPDEEHVQRVGAGVRPRPKPALEPPAACSALMN